MFNTMMLLGPFRFSAQTTAPDEIGRSSGWTWAEVERVGIAPALQFTGAKNQTMSLTGRLLPEYTGGLEQISRMRELAGLGIPLPLIDGTGRVHGLWVIEQLEETGRNHFSDGYPKLITFSLTLKKYGDGSGIFGMITKISRGISLFG